ncbi:MAG: N-acetylmuramoyl-L-alanine amidase [Thiogranum sp.]|jgi:N-acetylmuramoyl-L-alanine amidase|nr:N-acetylmuramoyl-L-alanine amidase [Thiogranum sp.]
MNRKPDIKTTVLRGVYEDNAGIPRSCHGRRRSKFPSGPSSSGRLGKLTLLALLGLVAIIGINFRFVTVSVTGPAAMQVMPVQSQPLLAETMPALSVSAADLVYDRYRPTEVLGSTTGDNRDGTVLSHVGMPLAELFSLKVKTIVIDPGHGGIDPGAKGHRGLMEKDVTLDIAKRLRDKLVKLGKYRVLLTRDDDRKVYLKERVAFAKAKRADLFISIHINSVPAEAGSVNYVETYYFGARADQQSLDMAEKENRDSDYTIGDFREVVARIGDTLKREESRELAWSIHKHLYTSLKRQNPDIVDAGFKAGPFMVLLGVQVPSVLVEVSCISNEAEEARLGTRAYRDSVADLLKDGIVEYLDHPAYLKTIDRGETQYVASQER